MASSSALGVGDIALVWDNAQGSADIVIIDNDVGVDRGLETAMLLSLLTDRRAENDDVPPSGDPRDRRGWWGDEFLPTPGDKFGSRLWLLDRSKLSNDTLLKAKQYAAECWQWLIDDKVASSIDVAVEFHVDPTTRKPNGLTIAPTVNRPGRDAVTFRFAHVWDHLQEDI